MQRIKLFNVNYKCGKTGKVVGVEHVGELVRKSIENVNRWNAEYLRTGCLKLIRMCKYLNQS